MGNSDIRSNSMETALNGVFDAPPPRLTKKKVGLRKHSELSWYTSLLNRTYPKLDVIIYDKVELLVSKIVMWR